MNVASLKARIEARSEYVTETGCLIWLGYSDRHGYGQIGSGRKILGTHRASWIVNCGDIPHGLGVLHKCDTPSCINPTHLFLGNQKANGLDMARKGRYKTKPKSACKNGHPYTEATTYYPPRAHGRPIKECRICRAEADRRRSYVRRKAL